VGHGEAVLKFSAGPTYGGAAADYFRRSTGRRSTTATPISEARVRFWSTFPVRRLRSSSWRWEERVIYLLDRANLGGQGDRQWDDG